MSISVVIEVGIGLILTYYILGLIASGLTRLLTDFMQLRAKDLETRLREVLEDSGKYEDLMLHPWVQNLRPKVVTLIGENKTRKLASLPKETFAKTFLDVIAPGEDGMGTVDDIRNAIQMLPAGKAKSQFLGLVNQGVEDINQARTNLEDWFDDIMINVSSIFGQHARRIVLAFSFMIVFLGNVDSIAIASTLWNAPAQRALATAAADQILAEDQVQVESIEQIEGLVGILESIQIPMFWTSTDLPQGLEAVAIKLAGLTITWIAASQGAPFWYDVLKRVRKG